MTIIQFPTNQPSHVDGTGRSGRNTLTLPVAPRSFSRIRFDPLDSNVRAVPPAGALSWLEENLQQGADIYEVEIGGPGDPLSDINLTLETVDLIHRKYPKVVISLTTIGLHGEEYATVLAKAGISKVTLRVDAVEKEVAEKIYAWIRPGNKTVPLSRAAKLLLDGQKRDVKAFIGAGCKVNIRTTVYPGFNDGQVEKIAQVMAGYGVEKMELVPCCPSAGEEERLLDPPPLDLMQMLRVRASKHLESEIVAEKDGNLGTDCPSPPGGCNTALIPGVKPNKERPNVTLVSMNGMDVDLHLGQAYQVLIYGPREDGLVSLLGTRPVPEPGSGSSRWQELAASLDDCFALLSASAGESPRRILGDQGITVIITDGEIEGTVELLYGGGKKKGKRP